MSPFLASTPTFILTIDSTGQITVSKLLSGDLSSAALGTVFTGLNDIAGASEILKAEMVKNVA